MCNRIYPYYRHPATDANVSPDLSELRHGCRTRNGTPVHIQFLGNNPEMMAYNAAKAARLGALGVDLNFGCPAKCVVRHKGGAILLKEPELIHKIVSTVRKAVPDEVPVTAKMRLGYLDSDLALDNALAIESAGASSLVVHARNKLQGYKPPAHWQELVQLREALSIPLVANGDIFNVEDAQRCREVSGCQDIMIGRGILRDPDLPAAIVASELSQGQEERWTRSLSLIRGLPKK